MLVERKKLGFFQNSKIDKITNFNISVAVKRRRDNNGGNGN